MRKLIERFKINKETANKNIIIYGNTMAAAKDQLHMLENFYCARGLKISKKVKDGLYFKNGLKLRAVTANENVRGLKWHECWVQFGIDTETFHSIILPCGISFNKINVHFYW